MADCPVCGNDVEIDRDSVAGELMECPDCGSELEIVGRRPFSLREAPMEDDDWED